jgi:dephospho-CoA kinase
MLNSLVWPAIFKSVKIKIGKSNKRIVVIDAALLLESNWDKYVHQVWTVFVPREEALRRICARDGLTEEQVSFILLLPNNLRESLRRWHD